MFRYICHSATLWTFCRCSTRRSASSSTSGCRESSALYFCNYSSIVSTAYSGLNFCLFSCFKNCTKLIAVIFTFPSDIALFWRNIYDFWFAYVPEKDAFYNLMVVVGHLEGVKWTVSGIFAVHFLTHTHMWRLCTLLFDFWDLMLERNLSTWTSGECLSQRECDAPLSPLRMEVKK